MILQAVETTVTNENVHSIEHGSEGVPRVTAKINFHISGDISHLRNMSEDEQSMWLAKRIAEALQKVQIDNY